MATKSIEKPLETKFVKWCESIKGKAIKGPAFMYAGIPDRIVILPNGGGTLWVEFKGGTVYQLTPIQDYWKRFLTNSDPTRYFVIDNYDDLKNLMDYCLTLIKK